MNAQPDRPSENVPRYYANWFGTQTTLYDVTLRFGFSDHVYPAARPDAPPDAPPESPEIEWLANVTLSWEEAVQVHDILGQRIAQYEDQVQPIRRWGQQPPPFDAHTNGGGQPGEDAEGEDDGEG